jgi:hypothetical protein
MTPIPVESRKVAPVRSRSSRVHPYEMASTAHPAAPGSLVTRDTAFLSINAPGGSVSAAAAKVAAQREVEATRGD